MKTITISEDTCELIKDQLQESDFKFDEYKDLIGKNLFIRTVTYHYIGHVEKITGSFLVLSNASWIADSGRFTQAINNGELNEVEILGNWNVNINSITSFGEWQHELPKEQK